MKYEITHNETGKKFMLDWQSDTPPSESDMVDIYAEMNKQSQMKSNKKEDIFKSAIEPFKQTFNTIKDVPKATQSYINKVEIPISQKRTELAQGASKLLGSAYPQKPLQSAKTPLNAAVQTLSGLGKTVIGKPADVFRTGQTGIGSAIESIPMTPLELGTTAMTGGMGKNFVPKKSVLDIVKQAGGKRPRISDYGKGGKWVEFEGYNQATFTRRVDEVDSVSKVKALLKNKQEEIVAKSKDPIVSEINDAIKKLKPIRGQQETLYSKERGLRLAKGIEAERNAGGGLAGFEAKKAKLGGELPKVKYEPLNITPEKQDYLFKKIEQSNLSEWDKLPAGEGLGRLFGKFGAALPTEGQLKHLEQVFGKEFTKTLLDKRTTLQKMVDAGYQIGNIPRSIMASTDMSAPLRQGLPFIGKKEYWGAFKKMFGAAASEKNYDAIQASIIKHPNYQLMRDSNLALTDTGRFVGNREERFMSSWAENMPGDNIFSKGWNKTIGKVVGASGRAYTGFLNKLRADVFNDLISKAEKTGLNPLQNMDLTKEIANYINVSTGRGNLGALEGSAKMLNTVLFSPKLMASRLTMLNPVYYIKATPFVRKEALKSLATLASTISTVSALGALAGAKVSTDPTNSDFAKIKIGNTRLDFSGGFNQYIRLMAQLATNTTTSSTTGKTTKLGVGYKPVTRYDLIQRFIEYKEAPIMSFVTNMLKGQSSYGEKFNFPKEIGNRFVPMVISDFIDLYNEDPKLLPLGIFGALGASLQTYKPKGKQ